MLLVTYLNQLGVMHYIQSGRDPEEGEYLGVQCDGWDAIISESSEGSDRGLLEIYVNEYDKTIGNLTAKQILECIER